jgi:hypothetical protein
MKKLSKEAEMLMAVVLIMLAVGERIWFDLGPNVELVTMASVLAGVYLPWRYKVMVPLAIMATSDLVLGWGLISLFTWSGFVVMGLLPVFFRKFLNVRWLCGCLSGLVGNVIFFLWTNLGVWWLDGWGMYADDLSGLLSSYVNGLPFLRVQMVSTLMFVPLAIFVVEEVRGWLRNREIVNLKYYKG